MNPWQEFERMRREMDRLAANFYENRPRIAPGFPAINVWANQDGAVITAELPGVAPEDIDIAVVGETLTLTGERHPEALQDGEKYHRRERGHGKFTRTFELPFAVEADKVEAMFEKGILQVYLPRAEAEKPKKIAIKTA
jgi:HSP20 family protein